VNDKHHHRLEIIGFLFTSCLLMVLGWVGDSAAQVPLGHRFEGEKIVVDLPDHWRNWTGPTHVVDIEEDGTFKPHFFRRVFDIIAEDRGVYGKPVEEPGIRKADVAIMNLERSFVRGDDGSVTVGAKPEQLIKFLNRDYLRFPGNESHIQLDGQLYAIVDTALSADEKEITLNLRNQSTGSTLRRTFGEKDKLDFPVYEYLQRVGVSRVGPFQFHATNGESFQDIEVPFGNDATTFGIKGVELLARLNSSTNAMGCDKSFDGCFR